MEKVPKLILSIHIPKTGGFTFGNVLKKKYGKGLVWLAQSTGMDDAAEKLKCLDWYRTKCFHGHTSYGLHQYIPKDIPYGYVTFLRHPGERLLSIYYFLVYNNFAKDIGFEKWLRGKNAFLDNGVTRMLAGNMKITNDTVVRKVELEDYRRALEHLRGFYFVGTTCTWQESVDKLASMLKWRSVPQAERVYDYSERRPHYDSLDSFVKLKIRLSQRWDFLLWNEAVRLNRDKYGVAV